MKLAPIRLPHGRCHDGCPWCTGPQRHEPPAPPTPEAVTAALADYETAVDELAFVGTDFGALDRSARTVLFDAARSAVRSERAKGIRLWASPTFAGRASMRMWRLSQVRTVEVLAFATDDAVLRRHGMPWTGRQALQAVERVVGADMRTGVHLLVGGAGASLDDELEAVHRVAVAGAHFVRLLPFLLLEGCSRPPGLRSLTVDDCVVRCARLLEDVEKHGMETARVGMQPRVDLVGAPTVISGPDHPSLRTLIESRRWRRRARTLLTREGRIGGTRILRFHPADEGFLRGHHGRNVPWLRKRFRLETLELRPDPDLPRGSLELGDAPERRKAV